MATSDPGIRAPAGHEEGTIAMQIVDKGHQLGVAVLRIVVGIVFLSAGIEKLFLSAEKFTAAGFLKFATGGSPILAAPVEGTIYNPTQAFWTGLADNATALSLIDVLVPYGQLAIGIGLILGLLTRFSATMGTLMMLLFFFAAWDFQYGVVNQHLTYAVVTAFIGYIGAGNYFGLDGMLSGKVGPTLRRWFLSGDAVVDGTIA
jgi:thiosulfate dehydrogenase (quinone) large subunit